MKTMDDDREKTGTWTLVVVGTIFGIAGFVLLLFGGG
jgi:hypothetical protein